MDEEIFVSPADSAFEPSPNKPLPTISELPSLSVDTKSTHIQSLVAVAAIPSDKPAPSETTSVHLLLTSLIGWIAWQEKESSVLRYFTHTFNAVRCAMKFGGKESEYVFELELDKKGMKEFEKRYKDKSIARDIDRIHGLFPAMGGKEDIKLVRFKISQGTGLTVPVDPTFESPIAMDALTSRIANLENAQFRSFDELFAIKQQWIAQMELMSGRLESIEGRLSEKVSRGVGDKLDGVQRFLLAFMEMELTGVPMNSDTVQIANEI